jgi:hypothetical protein
LRPHHPDKFVGSKIRWRGHIYSPLPFLRALSRPQVNTGVWGTAAFPSVYQTQAYPFAFWPHSARWQAGSLALLVAGIVLTLLWDPVWAMALVTIGSAGLLVTAWRCLRYALASGSELLPSVERWSARASRTLGTVLIAWLHFLQPFARACGQIRGMMHTARIFTPAERRAIRAHRPTMADLWQAVRLFVPRGRTSCYWSERWLSAEMLLTTLTQRLTQSPLAWMVEIDDGWQPDWDVRVGTGRWPWLGVVNVRVLVENHAAGKCLVRVTRSARLRVLPWAIGGAVALGIAGAAQIPGLLSSPAGSLVPGLLAMAVTAGVLWTTVRPLAAVNRAMARAATDMELQPMVEGSAAPREELGLNLTATRDAGQRIGDRNLVPVMAHTGSHDGADTTKDMASSGHVLPPIPLRPLKVTRADLQHARKTPGGDRRARG